MANIYGITNSKIFITGGAGFIASYLARALADDNQIVLYDNLLNNAFESSPLRGHPNVRLVVGDVRDLAALSAALDEDVEYIIHCAAIAGVSTVMKDPLVVMEVILQGTFNAAQAALKCKSLKRFVDFSTSEVFGARAYNVDEFTINPSVTIGEARWTYAISKLAGEFIVNSYHVKHNLPSVTVRPFNIYGPNQVGVGAVHHFVRRALAHENLTIHDDGSQIRSWCFVEDFVHGVLLTLVCPEAVGRSYNIGNPRSTVTVYNLAQMIINIAQSRSGIEYQQMNWVDVALRIPNITSARADLKFEPKVELEEGLARTIAWYRQKS